MTEFKVGDRVVIVTSPPFSDYNGLEGIVTDPGPNPIYSPAHKTWLTPLSDRLTALPENKRAPFWWSTNDLRLLAPLPEPPVDGGIYILDADGLDALGVGARIEASAGSVSAVRKESGWGSNWWTGILNSEEVTRYYRHLSFRVLDEGAPLEKPASVTVTVGSYAPDTVLVVQKDGSLKVVHTPS